MATTTEPQHLVIRADAGGDLGTGHVMRMIALAQAWQDRGGQVTIVSCQCPESLKERIIEEKISPISLGNFQLGGDEELAATLSLAKDLGTRWIAIDGYHFSAGYQKALKDQGFKVLAVDDYGHCETWHADIVLNQNISLSEKETTPASSIFLRGLRYTLLRREFKAGDSRRSQRVQAPLSVLVTFGGVDPVGATSRILKCLGGIKATEFRAKALVGPANPQVDEILKQSEDSPFPLEVIVGAKDMPALYDSVDRVISAGGSSCYEWMARHRPGWVTSIAPNQDEIVRAMHTHKVAAGVQSLDETDDTGLTDNLAAWLADSNPPAPAELDSYGADRVAAMMAEIPCWLRRADAARDARFLFDLANHPTVRSAGRHTNLIPWDRHLEWLEQHIDREQSALFVIEFEDRGPAGLVRLHGDSMGTWEIGISVHPDFRKERLAFTALSQVIKTFPASRSVKCWRADIKSDNVASQTLFTKLGFSLEDTEGSMGTWLLPIIPENPSPVSQ